MLAQIKSFLARHKESLYLILVMSLVAFLAFGLGRLSVYYADTGEFKVVYPEGKGTE